MPSSTSYQETLALLKLKNIFIQTEKHLNVVAQHFVSWESRDHGKVRDGIIQCKNWMESSRLKGHSKDLLSSGSNENFKNKSLN